MSALNKLHSLLKANIINSDDTKSFFFVIHRLNRYLQTAEQTKSFIEEKADEINTKLYFDIDNIDEHIKRYNKVIRYFTTPNEQSSIFIFMKLVLFQRAANMAHYYMKVERPPDETKAIYDDVMPSLFYLEENIRIIKEKYTRLNEKTFQIITEIENLTVFNDKIESISQLLKIQFPGINILQIHLVNFYRSKDIVGGEAKKVFIQEYLERFKPNFQKKIEECTPETATTLIRALEQLTQDADEVAEKPQEPLTDSSKAEIETDNLILRYYDIGKSLGAPASLPTPPPPIYKCINPTAVTAMDIDPT